MCEDKLSSECEGNFGSGSGRVVSVCRPDEVRVGDLVEPDADEEVTSGQSVEAESELAGGRFIWGGAAGGYGGANLEGGGRCLSKGDYYGGNEEERPNLKSTCSH
ncbi:hypothetical protein LguiA_001558 [Lonicera macranthoides]